MGFVHDRLKVFLRDRGILDDTLILFLSDNGGCAEYLAEDGWARFYAGQTLDGKAVRLGNRQDLLPGDA